MDQVVSQSTNFKVTLVAPASGGIYKEVSNKKKVKSKNYLRIDDDDDTPEYTAIDAGQVEMFVDLSRLLKKAVFSPSIF